VGVVAADGPLLVTPWVKVMLPPAATEVGEATLVVMKSAWVAPATISVALAALLLVLGSGVEELTLTRSLITVPGTAAALTLTAMVKVADPAAKLRFVQVMEPEAPTAGVVHDHPVGSVPMEEYVVFAGVLSVSFAATAVLGPLLVTTWV